MKTLEELHKARQQAEQALRIREGRFRARIVVAMGTCGIASGAGEVISAMRDELAKRGISDVIIAQTGCKGLCEQEPTVDVSKPGQPTVTYGYVTPEKARAIIAQHVVNDNIAGEWVVATEDTGIKHVRTKTAPAANAGSQGKLAGSAVTGS